MYKRQILQCFHDGDEMEHAEPLPLFSDLLKEGNLWSEEYDEEEDEMLSLIHIWAQGAWPVDMFAFVDHTECIVKLERVN